jgi:heptosyltransferase-2
MIQLQLKKILVIQTAFIGDVILSTSLITSLKVSNPAFEIDVLVRKGNESLLQNNPAINNIHIWDKSKNKFSSIFQTLKKIRKEKYDLIINLQRFASSGIMTVLGGAKETRGFSKNPLSKFFSKKYEHIIDIANPIHETRRNFSIIVDLCDGIIQRPALYPTNKDYEETKKWKSKDYICLAPASIWFTKQLPFQKWIELIQKYHTQYPSHAIYILGGKSDIELGNKISATAKCDVLLSLCGQLNFMQSATLMKDARMNYVNDSGPLHICSAMNAAVTAFFCSTTPDFGFGPLSDYSTIIETKEYLDCKPCGLHGYKECPIGHFSCGNSIEITIK